ncbi:MAG: TMEM175 family protein [Acidobacteriaceae bacterium]|nr:TMEM175 family protein [Acidobacteriaceae bacterium]
MANLPATQLSDKSRVEAFSDGVFAIALTLLVLEIHVPHLPGPITGHALLLALAQLWPSLLAMVFSFFVVLSMWYTHHQLMHWVRGVDKCFLFANGFLLLIVSFVPFPTAVLAEYLDTPARSGAVALYCATFIFVAVSHLLLLRTIISNRRLLHADVPDERIAAVQRAYTFGPFAYLLLLALSFRMPYLALTLTFSMWVLWLGLSYGIRNQESQSQLH